MEDSRRRRLEQIRPLATRMGLFSANAADSPDDGYTFPSNENYVCPPDTLVVAWSDVEKYSGGMEEADARRLLSCGCKSADPKVHILASRESIDSIASICGQSFPWRKINPVISGKRQPSDQIEATMKIPTRFFDQALGIGCYYTAPIRLSKDESMVCTHEDEVQVGGGLNRERAGNKCFFVCVDLKEKVYHFFGTKAVWKKLKAWQISCSKIYDVHVSEHRNLAKTVALGGLPEETIAKLLVGLGGHQEKSDLQRNDTAARGAEDTLDSESDKGKAQLDDQGSREKFTYDEGRCNREFEKLDKIGEGGFGIVFKARSRNRTEEYAVKRVEVSEDDLEEVIREVQVLAKLEHPKIVSYYDAWAERDTNEYPQSSPSSTDCSEWAERDTNEYPQSSPSSTECSNVFMPGRHSDETGEGSSLSEDSSNENVPNSEIISSLLYIQMELCGDDLCEKLGCWAEKRADFHGTDFWKMRVLEILEQLLNAVDHLHCLRIIHRDIKPSNIFFENKDTLKVKLGDFGLATLSHKQESPPGQQPKKGGSSHTKCVGTRLYAAPEQLNNTKYNNKVDIYSLGIVLAELLCLYRTKHELSDKLQRLQSGAFPFALFVYSKKKQEGPDMVLTVFRMCHENPELRPTARELLDSGLFVTKNKVIKDLSTEVQKKDEQISLLVRKIIRMEIKRGIRPPDVE